MITFEQFYKEFLAEDITFGLGEPPHYYSVSNVNNGHITIEDGYPDQNNYSGGLLKTPPNHLLIDDFRDKQINNGETNVRIKAALGYWTFGQNKALKRAIFHAARGRTAAPNASEINLKRSSQRISRNLLQRLSDQYNDAFVLRAESRSFWNRVVTHGIQNIQISKILFAINQLTQQIENRVTNTTARLFIVNLLGYLQNRPDLDQIYRDIAEVSDEEPLTLSKESLAKLLAYADTHHNVINGARINHIINQPNYNNIEYNKLINSLTHNNPNDGIDAAYIKKFLKSINVFNDFNQVLGDTNTVIVVDDNINQGDTFNEINAKITNFFPNVQNIFWVIGIIKIKQPNPPIQQVAQAAQQKQQPEVRTITFPGNEESLTRESGISQYAFRKISNNSNNINQNILKAIAGFEEIRKTRELNFKYKINLPSTLTVQKLATILGVDVSYIDSKADVGFSKSIDKDSVRAVIDKINEKYKTNINVRFPQ